MTTKKETPLKVTKGASSAQEATVKESSKNAVKPTYEQLQKQVEQLTQKINSVPENLDAKIEYFNRKKELIKKLELLTKKADELAEHLDNISQLAAENEFSNDRYSIIIRDSEGSYNDKDIFKFGNPVIIGEVLTFIIGKIEAKQVILKKEIEA